MTATTHILENAVQHHSHGRLDQAQSLYQQVLHTEPDHAGALLASAMIACQTGRYEQALDLSRKVIALRPNIAQCHNTLGVALDATAQTDEAMAAFEKAVALKPDCAEAYHNMALSLQRRNRYDTAVEKCRQALTANPSFVAAHFTLATLYHQQGRTEEAIDGYQQVIQQKEDWGEAHHNLANLLRAQGQNQPAIHHFRQAIRFRPELIEAYNNLGNALQEQGDYAEAVTLYQQALKLKPDYAEAHNNLGASLIWQGQYDSAVSHARQALALNPTYAEACNTLASAHMMQGQYQDAVTHFRRTIDLQPDYAEAHSNLGMILLLNGDFKSGWREYEWRLKARNNINRWQFTRPRWDGSALPGKRLLVYYEQGFGDTLQFIRYLPRVKNSGVTVIFQERPALRTLLTGFAGIDEFVTAADPNNEIAFDAHIPLLSLPGLFETTLETIPADVPYLFADPTKTDRIRSQLSQDTYNVGIVWTGARVHKNNRNRSCHWHDFTPLAHIDGVRLYGLQKDTGPEASHQEIMAANLGETFADFTDTAAAIAAMDLIIAVDTAVLHLAGAMGKPAWGLLAFTPDWRWMLQREDSPWYPGMRLFRQTRPEQWQDVFERVAAALREQMTTR